MVKTTTLGLVCASLFVLASAQAAVLESPTPDGTVSGIGFISGWKCDAGAITVTLNDGGHIPVAMEQPRADTRLACGTVHNGFITQINWALLGDGTHTAVAYDDGVEFARSAFTVVTTGEEVVTDVQAECVVPDFPAPGENARLEWNESTQHFELAEVSVPPDASFEDDLLDHITRRCGLYHFRDTGEWYTSLDGSHQGKGLYTFHHGPYRWGHYIASEDGFAACLPAHHMFVPETRCISPALDELLSEEPTVNVFHSRESTTVVAGGRWVVVTPDLQLHPDDNGGIVSLDAEGTLWIRGYGRQFTLHDDGGRRTQIDPDFDIWKRYSAREIDTAQGRVGRSIRAIRQGIRNISDRNFTPRWRVCS